MRGTGQMMSLGQRIAFYRRRRGYPQEVLASQIGRTADWLGRIENDRIELDRVSVIRQIAEALDVSLGDLLGEPSLLAWSPDSGTKTVPRLREALLDVERLLPSLDVSTESGIRDLHQLKGDVDALWTAYQGSRYAYVASRLPLALEDAQNASTALTGGDAAQANGLLAMTYQAATVLLTKLGESDLAWVSAERGLTVAQKSEDPAVVGSLYRSVTHALAADGRFNAAKQFTERAASNLEPNLGNASTNYLSVYGSLFLAGSVAAARDNDRTSVNAFLDEAEDAARRLGVDGNHMWTAFGPTNVAIHRVTSALELGDVQVAVDLAPRVDVSALPVERQVRHAIETARAYSRWNRRDEALSTLLAAENMAPEQIRNHTLSRNLVKTWIQQSKRNPEHRLLDIGKRMHVIE